MEVFNILAPGGYTTIQDAGRFGYQELGIPVTGVLDQPAFILANLLVGNPENTPALEITVQGPVMEALAPVDISVTGAQIGITINDRQVPEWHCIHLEKGDIVSIQQVQRGCRAYLALAGGFDVPEIMGSCSTYVGGKLGGFSGRAIQKGDILLSKKPKLNGRQRFIPDKLIPDYLSNKKIRAIPGPQDDYFDEGLDLFFNSEYLVTPDANRMGYRLQGPAVALRDGMPKSIVSEPSLPGCVQIPADEQPIILLVEQTVGGYAKIATIISSDLPKIAQATPGDVLKFEKTDIKTAGHIFKAQKDRMLKIRKALSY